MELKLVKNVISQAVIMRFNRTFMELKLNHLHSIHTTHNGFNRTFMELKLTCNYVVCV